MYWHPKHLLFSVLNERCFFTLLCFYLIKLLLVRKLFIFLLTLLVYTACYGRQLLLHHLMLQQLAFVTSIPIKPEHRYLPIKTKRNKPTLLQKAKIKLLQACQAKGYLVDGEMTERQKRQAKWSFILGLGSIVLLIIPYVGLLAIPAAITGLILGIKSVEGNSNTNGIIGIIASGLTLLLFIVAIALVAACLVSWN